MLGLELVREPKLELIGLFEPWLGVLLPTLVCSEGSELLGRWKRLLLLLLGFFWLKELELLRDGVLFEEKLRLGLFELDSPRLLEELPLLEE